MTTTKQKTRKLAAKASAPKATVIEAKSTPREFSEIRTLVSRWRWLEADQEYQAQTAPIEDESERLIAIHNGEQKKIEAKLAELAPGCMLDITCLLDFVVERADQFSFCGGEKEMLRNIRVNIWDILRAETDKACKEAVEKGEAEMRYRVRRSVETKEWFEAQIAELVDKHHAEQAKRKAA